MFLQKNVMKSLLFGLFALALSIVIFTFNSCTKENEEELFADQNNNCDTTAVSFVNGLLPVYASQCLGCHNAQAQQGGFNMDDFNALQALTLNGTMLEVLTLDRANPRAMPPGLPPLPPCEIEKLKAWARQGAPNN
jgi:hypothetical protein